MQGYSDKCLNLTTYWDKNSHRCVSCLAQAGWEISPNCGYDDKGGRHERPTNPCMENTFNDGSQAYCKNCTVCSPPYVTVTKCSKTADTLCGNPGSKSELPAAVHPPPHTRPNNFPTQESIADKQWAVPFAIFITTLVAGISAYVIYMRRRRVFHTRRTSSNDAAYASLSAPPGEYDLENILSPNILSAPLKTVLDNLDVLEELVILLDPESQGIKNTKHLAAHCSFPSTWITYTYSMKDSRSPLTAVLEALTSRHPDWTVGHLAQLLRNMRRNDAIAALAKLRLN